MIERQLDVSRLPPDSYFRKTGYVFHAVFESLNRHPHLSVRWGVRCWDTHVDQRWLNIMGSCSKVTVEHCRGDEEPKHLVTMDWRGLYDTGLSRYSRFRDLGVITVQSPDPTTLSNFMDTFYDLVGEYMKLSTVTLKEGWANHHAEF